MESYWFIITVSICILALIKSFITILSPPTKKLPPGPLSVPVIGNLLWLRNSISDLESILRRLKHRYGPLITMRIGSRPFIFVGNHSLAHTALVQNGAVFSDRPAPALTSKVLNPSQKGISSAPYGATWRIFRRNLTQEILHPARVRSYSGSRHWVLSLLVNQISKTSKTEGDFVRLIDHFQYAMFSLLVLMCFGDRLGEEQIKAIETVQRRLLVGFRRFNNLNLWGKLGKVLLRGRWKELSDLCQDQENVLLPLIRARIAAKQNRELGRGDQGGKESVVAYVDTLMDLQLPEEDNRKLQDWEMVNLCSEFLNAGTDTTSTALQWIMANLVKYPELQTKLYEEIVSVKGQPPVVVAGGSLPGMVVEEEDLQKMPYLKAVVLEGLRRHPPGHFVLPHKVSRDVDLDGYVIPKNAIVNFMVADMGWDAKVWDKPMEFRPERFLDEGVPAFDVTGSKEIKMMPFGAGRRICPASGLAMLHLEYFVANLIWYFEWTPRQGEEIDLTEKQEFTIVMKNPLCARISPRNC